MKRLLNKLIEFLLKKTEHLDTKITDSEGTNDPMQKKIQQLLAKKEMMKSAVHQANQANQAKNATNTDNTHNNN